MQKRLKVCGKKKNLLDKWRVKTFTSTDNLEFCNASLRRWKDNLSVTLGKKKKKKQRQSFLTTHFQNTSTEKHLGFCSSHNPKTTNPKVFQILFLKSKRTSSIFCFCHVFNPSSCFKGDYHRPESKYIYFRFVKGIRSRFNSDSHVTWDTWVIRPTSIIVRAHV